MNKLGYEKKQGFVFDHKEGNLKNMSIESL